MISHDIGHDITIYRDISCDITPDHAKTPGKLTSRKTYHLVAAYVLRWLLVSALFLPCLPPGLFVVLLLPLRWTHHRTDRTTSKHHPCPLTTRPATCVHGCFCSVFVFLLSLSLLPSCYIISHGIGVEISKKSSRCWYQYVPKILKYRMIYREIYIRYRILVYKPPVFLICECFLYCMPSLIFISGSKAKNLISRVFVILRQYFSEDRVFAWIMRLVFAWTTHHICWWHDCCTYTRFYAGTAYVS